MIESENSAAVIITGGGQRIGLAFAKSLIKHNIKVIVTYRTQRESIQALTDLGADCYKVDLTDQAQRDDFISDIKKNHTQLRAIIHNASAWTPESSEQLHTDTLAQNMLIHVTAPYILNLELSSLLHSYAKQYKTMADIIHMTDYVVEKGSKKHIAYAASKAALANMTLSFATQFAPRIKVNNIAPALLMFNEHDDDDYKAKAARKSLLPAAPGPQEATDTLHYIFNSQYVTGRTFALDGGRQLKG